MGFPDEDETAKSSDPAALDAPADASWDAAPSNTSWDEAWGAAPVAEASAADDAWGDAPMPERCPVEASLAWGVPENLSAATPAPVKIGEVAGLAEWLAGLSLQKYESKAAEWCAQMGAVSVEEIEE